MQNDSNLTSNDLSLAVVLAMCLNQMLTNLLPAALTTLLLALATGGELAAIPWGIAIWAIYSLGSICSLVFLLPHK